MTETVRHALVTGGTRGIGYGIATALQAVGYRVTVTGLTEAECAEMPADPPLPAVPLDVTDAAAVAALVAGLERLDLLVNCAGMIARGQEFEIEAFRRVVEVNLTGTMRMCLACKPLLKAEGGSIVNTASMLSFFGGPTVPAYSASKGGVAQLTKALAVAWAEEGIRVNAIAPGWIETALTRPLVDDAARSSGLLARTPMRRWGQPQDLGGAVVFLASQTAGFVTGVVLPVDGGYLAC